MIQVLVLLAVTITYSDMNMEEGIYASNLAVPNSSAQCAK